MLRLAVEGVVGAVEQSLYLTIRGPLQEQVFTKRTFIVHVSSNVMFSPTRACLLAFYISSTAELFHVVPFSILCHSYKFNAIPSANSIFLIATTLGIPSRYNAANCS